MWVEPSYHIHPSANNPPMPQSSSIAPSRTAPKVALETTLLVHGVPVDQGLALARRLTEICRQSGAEPAVIGVLGGRPVVGMTEPDLEMLLGVARAGPHLIPKLNTGNLGAALFRGQHGATTVSATMELAARAGLQVFATGGLGGVHPGLAERPDISADLGAFTRFPIAVVTSGVKSILDVAATRELLETLGICIVGYQTDDFPAFYLRKLGADAGVGKVDVRFDDVDELARFIRFELARTGRGIVVANPIPREAELNPRDWDRWLLEAQAAATAQGATGRGVTPAVLGALHRVSNGATLRANLALVENNVDLAAKLAVAMQR